MHWRVFCVKPTKEEMKRPDRLAHIKEGSQKTGMRQKMDGRIVKYLLLATLLILAVRYFDVLWNVAGNLRSIAAPLLTGCVIAYVLNIVLRQLERIYFPHSTKKLVSKTRRPVCLALSILLIVAVFVLVIVLVVPELISAFRIIGQATPVLFDRAVKWIADNTESFPQVVKDLQNMEIDWNSLGDKVWNYLKAGLAGDELFYCADFCAVYFKQ